MTEPSDTPTKSNHPDRRYVCEGCGGVVRARWGQWGDGYPGYFAVGCDCQTVPVVPQMSQAETPREWRVERPECCRGVEVSELESFYSESVCDYRCPECGATYRYDGTMSTAPDELADDNHDRPEPEVDSFAE